MEIKKYDEVENVHGERYKITLRKHPDGEDFDKYGYLYSIKIQNADPEAFDLNTHIFLYDYWKTAYKRFRELTEEYKTIKPLICRDVDARTGLCKKGEAWMIPSFKDQDGKLAYNYRKYINAWLTR
jgi:hypothetical protein